MQMAKMMATRFDSMARRRSSPSWGRMLAALTFVVASGASADSGNGDPQDDGEEIEVYEARSCPEIFGDEDVVKANKARRTGRFHGVKRGTNDVTVTHQVAWWSEPTKLKIPAATVVDVLPADDEAATPFSAPSTEGGSEATPQEAEGGGEDTPPSAVDATAPAKDVATESATPTTAPASPASPSVFEAEKKAANEGAGLVVQHGSIATPSKPTAESAPLRLAHVELTDAYKDICEPGVYEVTVDDSLGQDARVYAMLEEGMLIESGDRLAFLVLDDGPKMPSMRMIWRSAYAIEFESTASSSKVKKSKSKAKPKTKKKKRRRRKRK